jgi:hypothetical protein
MNALLVIILGVYLIAVVYHGNGNAFIATAWDDTQKMALWVVAWVVLLVVAKFSRVGVAFLVLAIVASLVKSSSPLMSTLSPIWGDLKASSSNTGARKWIKQSKVS